MRNKNLPSRLKTKLRKKLHDGVGRSRHADKRNPDVDPRSYIYSYSTYHNCKKVVDQYCRWYQERYPDGYKARDINDSRARVGEYLQERTQTVAATTVWHDAACLAKAYDCGTGDFDVDLPHRAHSMPTRGRSEDVKRPEIPADNALFGRCYGLRRNEMDNLKPDALMPRDDGSYDLHLTIGTKGGRERIAPFCGTDEDRRAIADYVQSHRDNVYLLRRLPRKCNEHALRREYARGLYKRSARPLDQLSGHDLYKCRGDRRGEVYDRRALAVVSKALGHNRVDVVVSNYMR